MPDNRPHFSSSFVRQYYARTGLPMPQRVREALSGKRKAAPKAEIRYYDQEPAGLEIDLPFLPRSRNQEESNPFARGRSKKAFIARVRACLIAQDVRAFRGKVEVETELHFSTRRERDEDNYLSKALIDALKGVLFADDAARFVTWKAPVFVVDGTERTVLRIRPAGVG